MSDDTPTQRFPEQGGDSPTERISAGEVQEDLQEEKQKSRGLMIGLIAAGALLLIAIIVLVVVLLPKGAGDPQAGGSGSPTPEVSDTPSAEPTPTESASPSATAEPSDDPDPQAQPAGPAITSFKVTPGTVLCNTQAPVQPQNRYLTITWTTTGADEIRIGTYDPYGDYSTRYYNLPPNGDASAIGQDVIYQCPEPTQTFRIEIVADGQVYKKEVTVKNNGDLQ
jgi:predicted nucleic acid-binding Zn ribbon protein